MPFTPYHLGPSGLAGLLLRRRLDVPVFLAANVLIDLEVLADNYLAPGWPVHQLWHFHTLLIGGLAGALFGVLIYSIKPLRRASEKGMALLGLPARATWQSMTLGGLLGSWTHILTDSFYHYDVQLFWPYAKNPIFTWMQKAFHYNLPQLHRAVQAACLILLALAALLYAALLARKTMQRKRQRLNAPKGRQF
jgi:hypothetical protein